MEKLELKYKANVQIKGRALAGVVSSGDCEVLITPGASNETKITISTSIAGSGHKWKAIFDRTLFGDVPIMNMEINDFGATPGVAKIRIDQAMEEIYQTNSIKKV